ncbi:MAG: AAA family ATPase [Promethearchaeota archaeon]
MKFPTVRLNTYFNKFEFFKGIISIWGDFGVGKTTFALQTAFRNINDGKKILFFYTKPNFPTEKMLALFKTSPQLIDKITYINPKDFYDLYRIVFNLEFLILKRNKNKENPFKLIIIDSITDLYRLELNKEKKERNYNLNYNLNQILANLFYINKTYKIEILIINELSRKTLNDHIIEVQAGGKVMEYWISYNIKINRTEKLNERRFLVFQEGKLLLECLTNLTINGFI